MRLRKYIEKNFEYVGENFSKKVREIYYDKKSKKTIYGKTTKERKELAEEGIDLISIPWVIKKTNFCCCILYNLQKDYHFVPFF